MKTLYKLCPLHTISYLLVLIGAWNWGAIGIGGFIGTNLNIVNLLLGTWPMVEQGVYLLVGLSAIVMLFHGSCSLCGKKDLL